LVRASQDVTGWRGCGSALERRLLVPQTATFLNRLKYLYSQQGQAHSLELNYTSIYFTPLDPTIHCWCQSFIHSPHNECSSPKKQSNSTQEGQPCVRRFFLYVSFLPEHRCCSSSSPTLASFKLRKKKEKSRTMLLLTKGIYWHDNTPRPK